MIIGIIRRKNLRKRMLLSGNFRLCVDVLRIVPVSRIGTMSWKILGLRGEG
jgi:hypothetical protein